MESGKGDEDESQKFLEGFGRGLEAFMIAIHPMTQTLEEKPWKDQVAKELGLTGEVQWVLRLGYLKSYPDPVSLRMSVPWFVQT